MTLTTGQSVRRQTSDVRPPVIFLMGPTASGKTGLAVELVQRLPLEIINVDSALVYKGLDIGAAKPDADTLKKAPHRLLAFRDPAQPYSAAQFREDALREIADIHRAGKVPLLVGGTMLYFRTLLEGMTPLPAADPALRARLDAEAAELGWPAMHARLAEVDPETAARLKANDRQRLQRALEVYQLTGVPLSEHHRNDKRDRLSDSGPDSSAGFAYTVKALALAPAERSVLHERIAVRFREMLEQGLLEEVSRLRGRGDLHADLPAMRAVGYRQVWNYLAGQYDREEMLHKAVVATRQLAKRQLTWLRSWPDLHWLESDDPALLDKALALLEPLLDKLDVTPGGD